MMIVMPKLTTMPLLVAEITVGVLLCGLFLVWLWHKGKIGNAP